MHIGNYVIYKHRTYLVCGLPADMVEIIHISANQKLRVAPASLLVTPHTPAKICHWQNGQFLVTGKGNILSLRTRKWMEWPTNHGGRKELLRQAGIVEIEA